jgi:hypothetical protein
MGTRGWGRIQYFFGDPIWTDSGPPPEPLTVMAVMYERAFGGPDSKSETPEKDWDRRNSAVQELERTLITLKNDLSSRTAGTEDAGLAWA